MFRVLTCLTAEHDYRLVVLAGVVCFLASITAVNLFHRARSTRAGVRAAWLITAGAATGCGIWGTHFIAMLAYEPGVPTAYDIGLTLLSLVIAAAVTGLGLSVAVYSASRWNAVLGGGIVGGGIACMHYLGMWVLEVPGRVTWWLDLVVVSIALGMVFGMGALAIALRRDDMRATVAAALLLTLAIVSHHFTAMGAVELIPDPMRTIAGYSLSPTALALAIAAAAIAVLGLSLIGAISDRRLAARTDEFDQQIGELARDRQRIIQQSKQDLERLNRDLERQVDERTKDLQTTRSLLEATLQNVNQGIMMIGSDHRVPVCNRRAMELLDLPPELMASCPRWEEVVAHLRRKGVLDEEDGNGMDACDEGVHSYQCRRPNGVVLDVRSVPLARGGTVRTFTDITELLSKERLSTLGQLTATVAHELRNPLSAIRTTLPVIHEAALAGGIALDRPMARIERSIARCNQLVTGLLDYTRPAVLTCKPTYIDAWLGPVLDEQTMPSLILLQRDLAATDCIVNLDPDRFRRVIINLIDNAMQAIEQSPACGSAQHKVCVTTRVSDQLEITVSDTGPGIAPNILPRIFEPLFSTKSFGTGLGLPTVKQLVEQHRGTISIDSKPGQGTVVRISLPISGQQSMAA
jgi:NO-binding membrane sensor protein with MHYT domain/nitrogen-specific signal transduction histidine kinase